MEKSYKIAIGVIVAVIVAALVIGGIFVATSDKDDTKHVTLDKEGETYYLEDFGASKLHLDITANDVKVLSRSYGYEMEKLVVVLHGNCMAKLKDVVTKSMDLKCESVDDGDEGALNVVNAIVDGTLNVSSGKGYHVYLSTVVAGHIAASYDTLFYCEVVHAADLSAVAHGSDGSEFLLFTCFFDDIYVSGSESVSLSQVHPATEGSRNGRFFHAEGVEELMLSDSYGIKNFGVLPAYGIDAQPVFDVQISDEYVGLAVELGAEGACADVKTDCGLPLHLDIEGKKNAEICACPYNAEDAERGDVNVYLRGRELSVSGDEMMLNIFGGAEKYNVLSEKSTVDVMCDVESIAAEDGAKIVLEDATIGKLTTKGEAELEGSGMIVDYYYAKRPNIPTDIIVTNEHPEVEG